MTILDEIAAYAKVRVEEDKKAVSLSEIKRLCIEKKVAVKSAAMKSGNASDDVNAEQNANSHRFMKALQKPGMSFISEVKKASPSKGIIAEDFPYTDIAKAYEDAGTDCISCLTEPKWFLGSDRIFTEIRENVTVPMIRKDFTVDEYQIYQAYLMGADAVLLICAILSIEQLKAYLDIVEDLGMDALVETHDEQEIRMAVEAGARIIGVNNRNLKDFSVDFSNAERLRSLIPADCVYVAESGVKGPDDIRVLKRIGADAVLIGETLMRADDKKAMLDALKNA